MKKFTRLNISEQNKKEQVVKNVKTIEKIIKENVSIQFESEEHMLNENNNFDNTSYEIDNYFTEELKKDEVLFLHSLKEKYGKYIDQIEIDNMIKQYENKLNEYNTTLSPSDVFNESDYKKYNNKYILEKFDFVPNNFYGEYLNESDINNYFNLTNNVEISFLGINEGWSIRFVNNTDKSYHEFLKENKEFIINFIKSTYNYVGKNKLSIDNYLIRNLYF